MNSDIPGIENDRSGPAEDSVGEPREKPRRRGSFAASLALLVALVALAGTAWMWWQDQTSRGQEQSRVLAAIDRMESADSDLALKVRQIRDELDGLTAADDSEQLDTLERQLATDRARLERAERSIPDAAARTRALQATVDSIQDRLLAVEAAAALPASRQPDAGRELDVAEVDYLLRLANERLQLFADPAAADRALELADRHLAAMDEPVYFQVRQGIAAARQALGAVRIPDYAEVAARLDGVQSAIGTLPFRGSDAAPEPGAPEQADGWWAKLKGVFSGLVTVRRSDSDERVEVNLKEMDYVRQRLWLQLEVAHLSLMRRDQAAFRAALGRVQETVDTWFDGTDRRVQAVTETLGELAALGVEVELPDISAPWSALRRIRGASAAATPAAVPPAIPEDVTEEASPGPAGPEGGEGMEGTEPADSAPAPADAGETPEGGADQGGDDAG